MMHRKYILLLLLIMTLVGCGNRQVQDQTTQTSTNQEKAKTSDPTEEIRCELSEEGVLSVSGNGVIEREQVKKTLDECNYSGDFVCEIQIREGITGIGEYAFANLGVKKVDMPNTVQVMEEGAFYNCCFLKEIIFPKDLKELGKEAFYDCSLLEKVVLPSKLERCPASVFSGCIMLTEIQNQSSNDFKLSKWAGIEKSQWQCDGEVVKKIPAGKTITIKPEIYQISYDLNGGMETGTLPSSYDHTQGCELPNTVRRKGYSFVGWELGSEKEGYSITDAIKHRQRGNKIARALWMNFQLENIKGMKFRAFFDFQSFQEKGDEYLDCNIRYSLNEDMSDYEYVRMERNETETIIANLQGGKRYYVEYAVIEDLDDWDTIDALPWQGKMSIVVE